MVWHRRPILRRWRYKTKITEEKQTDLVDMVGLDFSQQGLIVDT